MRNIILVIPKLEEYSYEEKLEKDPTNPEIIVTVRGIGYKLGEENAKR